MAYFVFVKFLSIVCLVVTLSTNVLAWKNIPEEFIEPGNIMMNTCVGRIGISRETVENAREFIFPEHGTAEEELYKCYLKCIFEELGVWDNGMVDHKKQAIVFPPNLEEKYRSNHVNCKDTRGETECETAYLTMECYKNNDPDIYFVV